MEPSTNLEDPMRLFRRRRCPAGSQGSRPGRNKRPLELPKKQTRDAADEASVSPAGLRLVGRGGIQASQKEQPARRVTLAAGSQAAKARTSATTRVVLKRRRVITAAVVGVVAVAATGAAAGVAVTTSTPRTAAETSVDSRHHVRNLPPQAAALVYGSPTQAKKYAHPGGLVVAGRDNYQARAFKDVSVAGGTVLIYLDAVIDNPHGRYHTMLIKRSACGPATTRWPGNYKANSWGYLNDFRVGSVLQRKLECVLEVMVAENPYMAGWFADDIGSRSWFPDFDWGRFPQKTAYRAGAIALTKTFRKVANRHHLIFLVNGTWAGGSLTSAGGGYPNPAKSGTALAEGGVVEHHDGEIGYFGPYGCSKQWADQSPISRGKAFNYAVTSNSVGSIEYLRSSCYAFVNNQVDYGIDHKWGSSHSTGLPSQAR